MSVIRIVAIVWLLACSPTPTEVRVLPLEPLPGQDPAASGEVQFPSSSTSPAAISVRLRGLVPDSQYVLCLNPWEPDSPTSQRLGSLGVHGWPLGAIYDNPLGYKEGHWNFVKIKTNARGVFEQAFSLPLPPLDYRIRFLVKTAPTHGSVSVLQSDALLMAVSPSPLPGWLTGTMVALAFVPLVFIARVRARDRSGDRPTRHRPSCDEPLEEGAPHTLVERARADGTLRHSKHYSWIEIHGRRKTFRPRQALVFRILCEQDPNCDGIPQEHIVKEWEAEFKAKRANPVRVRDIFRASPDEPGDFIVRVPGPASVYRLRLTPNVEPNQGEVESCRFDGEADDPERSE